MSDLTVMTTGTVRLKTVRFPTLQEVECMNTESLWAWYKCFYGPDTDEELMVVSRIHERLLAETVWLDAD